MKNIHYGLLATAISLFSACGNTDKTSDRNADSALSTNDTTLSKTENAADLDTNDVAFFRNAAIGGLVEVESSKEILQATTSQPIKELANMIVKDHENANVELKTLAEGKGYKLPNALSVTRSLDIEKMNTFKNEGRDEYYVRLMLKEHQNAIDLFSLAGRSSNKEISGFALKTLPTLKAHHKHAMKVDSLIQLPKANQGDDPLKLSDRKKKESN